MTEIPKALPAPSVRTADPGPGPSHIPPTGISFQQFRNRGGGTHRESGGGPHHWGPPERALRSSQGTGQLEADRTCPGDSSHLRKRGPGFGHREWTVAVRWNMTATGPSPTLGGEDPGEGEKGFWVRGGSLTLDCGHFFSGAGKSIPDTQNRTNQEGGLWAPFPP